MKEPTRQQIKEAFQATIARWEKIVVRPDYYYESDCKLCRVYEKFEGDKSCHRYCPIRSYGNHKVCYGTPHDAFSEDNTPENALAELNFLRKVYIWWIEKEGKIVGQTCKSCEDFEAKKTPPYGICMDVTESQKKRIYPDSPACMRWRKAKEEKKEEWVDVTRELEWKIEFVTPYYYVGGYYKGERIVNLDMEGIWIPQFPENKNFKTESDVRDFRILKKS